MSRAMKAKRSAGWELLCYSRGCPGEFQTRLPPWRLKDFWDGLRWNQWRESVRRREAAGPRTTRRGGSSPQRPQLAVQKGGILR